MKLSIRSLVLVSVLLAAACGGTKIEIANNTGRDFLLLSVEINGEVLDWSSVDNEESVSGSISISGTPMPPVAVLEWDDGFGIHSEEICLLDSASSAKSILIHLGADATSLSYTF